MEERAPGKTLLKVTGILYIIVSALLLLSGIVMLAGGGLLTAGGMYAGNGLGAFLGAGVLVLAVVALAQGVFGLIMGILGVKNCDKPEKAGACIVMGILVLVLGVIGLIGNLVGQSGSSALISSVAGLIIPALYTWGAFQNKKAA